MTPLLQLLSIVLYILVGTGYYHLEEGWSYIDCMYFSMVTMSTVGYGDFTPTSGWSQFFTVAYCIFGIAVVFTQVGSLVSRVTGPFFEFFRVRFERLFPTQGYDIDGNGEYDYYVPPHYAVFCVSRLTGPFISLASVQLVAAACFCVAEGWDFGTSIYHCFITATTTGYGEITITTEGGRFLAFWHIVSSVSLLASFISELDHMREERRAQRQRQALVLAKLDEQLWETLMPDHQEEIDKFDFVYGMLVKLKLVDEADIQVFAKIFERHHHKDHKGHGKLKRDLLKTIGAEYQQRASQVGAIRNQPSMMSKRVTSISALGQSGGVQRSRRSSQPLNVRAMPTLAASTSQTSWSQASSAESVHSVQRLASTPEGVEGV